MTRKLMMMAVAVAAALCAWADVEIIGSYEWTFRINGDTAEIYKDNGSGNGTTAISPAPTGALKIPPALNGKPVMSIGNAAFANCTALEKVSIGARVTSINNEAFDACSGLVKVSGVVVDGVGYGMVTSKSPAASWGVTVK